MVVATAVLFSFAACDDYLDINESPNAPTGINDQDLILSDITATTAYNLVGGGNFTRYSAQWIQHIANNAAPPSNDTYRFTTASFNNEWAFTSYAGVLINCKIVIDEGTPLGNWNHVAIAKIMMAHNYAILADFFSDIPFSQAILRTTNLNPSYDGQEQVFEGVQNLLDDAIVDIDKNSEIAVGSGDFFYGGDMAQWRKLAYALKARYHLRLTNAPGKTAAGQAQLAKDALANAMTGRMDEAAFDYTGEPGAEAPWQQWITKFATTIQISNYMVTTLLSSNDPRLSIIADTTALADTIPNNNYVGHANGTLNTAALANISNIGAFFLDAAADVPLMTYEEQLFIEAEANLWLNDVPAAEMAYEAGVRSHMDRLSGQGELGTIIDRPAQDAYLLANPMDDQEDIIRQKYIAAFVYGSVEAYNDYRRTGFPSDIQVAQNADFNQIPTRIPYTDTEINNNSQNVPADVTETSLVWWDPN